MSFLLFSPPKCHFYVVLWEWVQSIFENIKVRSLSWMIFLFDYSQALFVNISWTFLQIVLQNHLFPDNFTANYFVQLNFFKIREQWKKWHYRANHKNSVIQDQVAPALNSFVHTKACSSYTLYRMRRCCPGRNANNLRSMIL